MIAPSQGKLTFVLVEAVQVLGMLRQHLHCICNKASDNGGGEAVLLARDVAGPPPGTNLVIPLNKLVGHPARVRLACVGRSRCHC